MGLSAFWHSLLAVVMEWLIHNLDLSLPELPAQSAPLERKCLCSPCLWLSWVHKHSKCVLVRLTPTETPTSVLVSQALGSRLIFHKDFLLVYQWIGSLGCFIWWLTFTVNLLALASPRRHTSGFWVYGAFPLRPNWGGKTFPQMWAEPFCGVGAWSKWKEEKYKVTEHQDSSFFASWL